MVCGRQSGAGRLRAAEQTRAAAGGPTEGALKALWTLAGLTAAGTTAALSTATRTTTAGLAAPSSAAGELAEGCPKHDV